MNTSSFHAPFWLYSMSYTFVKWEDGLVFFVASENQLWAIYCEKGMESLVC